MAENEKPDRPLFVTIIAALYIILGVVAIIGGVAMLSAPGAIPGIIALVVGIGLWKGWKIFWYLGVIFAIIYLILSIITVVALVGIIPLIISIIILWYLFKPNVKAFFGVGS